MSRLSGEDIRLGTIPGRLSQEGRRLPVNRRGEGARARLEHVECLELDGARAVHEQGGVVLAQDEASSAVWGMPGKVTEAGIASATLPLVEIAGALKQRVNAGRLMKMDTAHQVPSAMVPRREMNDGLF